MKRVMISINQNATFSLQLWLILPTNRFPEQGFCPAGGSSEGPGVGVAEPPWAISLAETYRQVHSQTTPGIYYQFHPAFFE